MLKVGDRVSKDGYTWHSESRRHGTVTRVYTGTPSCNAPGILLCDVLWDGHSTASIGFIVDAGDLYPSERKEEYSDFVGGVRFIAPTVTSTDRRDR